MLTHLARNAAAATSLAAVLTGCAHDTVAPMTSSITPSEAVAAGARLSREIGTNLSAVTLGGSGSLAAARSGMYRGAPLAASEAAAPCPEISNPADPDHDGIPDSATLTFALPQCESVMSGDTTEVTGVIYLSAADNLATAPPGAVGYTATFSDLTVHFGAADPDSTATEMRNGAQLFFVAPEGIVTSYGFRIAHQDIDGLANVVDRWNATFTPSSSTAIVPGLPLPTGLFMAQGQTSWQRGGSAAEFEIATVVPLAYDPGCPASGANRFRSGEVHAALASPGVQAYVRIVFANCAPPSVTFIEHQS